MNSLKMIEVPSSGAFLAIGASVAVLVLLAVLHMLSPEFNPAWRMVSEYANGEYAWILSLMFFLWGASSWVLAYTLRTQVQTTAGKIGLLFLVVAGIGEVMASVFDINHKLHSVSAMIGIPSLAIAAMLISVNLVRVEQWSVARTSLLWTANLTWISILLMALAFVVMMATYAQAGGDISANAETVTTLPKGVIALVGWANRFLIFVYCAWVMTIAWWTIKLGS
ncbi:MAG: DUF998 domain-containing protein [Anaerolineales bacterium]|nr:DUF998 domain-containing protein [Anaerolineales bacterium]